MGSPNFSIISAWAKREESAVAVAGRLLLTFDQLEQCDSALRGWEAHDDDWDYKPYRLAPLRDQLERFISSRVVQENGEPFPEDGFSFIISASPDPPLATPVSLMVQAGSKIGNHCRLEIGMGRPSPTPAFVKYAVFHGALLDIVAAWSPKSAAAVCFDTAEGSPCGPGEPPFPYSQFHMPWVAYLNAERAGKVTGIGGLMTERTPDGGLVMISTTDRFDPTNVEHMRSARRIAEIMIEHGQTPGY